MLVIEQKLRKEEEDQTNIYTKRPVYMHEARSNCTPKVQDCTISLGDNAIVRIGDKFDMLYQTQHKKLVPHLRNLPQ
ncbi:uncharacterized protein G2W53_030477 [Senna tora]|uniref:Uncharacterized protein n=1 Tax=Senna tora TaxID=362788 RepID=A0A834T7B6_9FABA|nr:uncharacterized protein G2W53_030477 [Senna tora]